MAQFFLHQFTISWAKIEEMAAAYEKAANQKHNGLQPVEFRELVPIVSGLQFICKSLELKLASHLVNQFERDLDRHISTYQTVDQSLRNIKNTIKLEMDSRFLAFIPPEKTGLFEKQELFGKAVYDAFEDARDDIKDAGTCMSLELYTAAVFHLMRVAELGLRNLATALNVKLPCEIEFATWGNITQAIDGKLVLLKGKKRTKQREAKLHFYSSLLLDIRAFQYLWRDPVMHCRSRYDEWKAQSALDNVRKFMQSLATNPVKWSRP